MAIIGGFIGGMLSLLGGLLNSLGVSTGLLLQNVLAAGGDFANNLTAVLGGNMANTIAGAIGGGGGQDALTGGLSPSWISTDQLGTLKF
jgi:hypothetical protein